MGALTCRREQGRQDLHSLGARVSNRSLQCGHCLAGEWKCPHTCAGNHQLACACCLLWPHLLLGRCAAHTMCSACLCLLPPAWPQVAHRAASSCTHQLQWRTRGAAIFCCGSCPSMQLLLSCLAALPHDLSAMRL